MNTILMSAEEIQSALDTLAGQLLKKYGDCRNIALVGIQRRGVDLANRLKDNMVKTLGKPVLSGSLDIALYRDDWTTKTVKPAVLETSIPFDVNGKHLILVDDVLYTGRTIRAALEALADFGRPSKVELFVLVDRGHRELPIHADYIGLTVTTARTDRVDVLLNERDGTDKVQLVKNNE